MDELEQAQRRLGRAIEKARAGEDQKLAAEVRERGEQLANLLLGLLRMARVHAADNRAFDQPITELRTAIQRLSDLLGTLHLVAVGDQTYVNEIRVRTQASRGGKDLGGELNVHNTGGISFTQVPEESHLRRLVALLSGKPATAEKRTAVLKGLRTAGAEGIELTPVYRFKLAGEASLGKGPPPKPDPAKVREELLATLDEGLTGLVAGRAAPVVQLRRQLARLLTADPAAAALWYAPMAGSEPARHAVRVAQHALFVGRALGLPEGLLLDLGVAALLHDVGYTTAEGRSAALHGSAGVGVLLRQAGFHEAKVRRALVAAEHGRDARDPRGKPTLFARIIRLCEDYDTLRRPDGGRLSGTLALCSLVPGAGSRYDPVLLQLLCNTLGYYPPGAVLQLSDGRRVRVVALARDGARFALPLTRDEATGEELDLATAGATVASIES